MSDAVPGAATRVEVRRLVKRYTRTGPPTVDGVDIDVQPGTLTALLGPSGCGKTTTLKVVAGLLVADDGDVLFDGASVLPLAPERRPVAMVFQKPLLFPHLSVGENVAFGLRMRGVAKRQARERVGRMLDLVHLGDLAARRVGEMSGGQEQRVALARALVTEPQVLLLDEPFSQLDAGLRVEMRELVRTLQRQLGVTTLFVTHDQEEAVSLADEVVLMLDGRIEQHSSPRDFYERPTTVRTARFFGGRNEISGQVTSGCFRSVLADLPTALPDGPAVAVARQEAVVLGRGDLVGKVVESRYLGTHTAVVLVLEDGTRLHAQVPAGTPTPSVGSSTTVDVPALSCTVLPSFFPEAP